MAFPGNTSVVPAVGMPTAPPPAGPGAQIVHLGNVSGGNLASVQQSEAARAADNNITPAPAPPMLAGLAGHIRKEWTWARDAKQQSIEPRMLQNMRARRGEYDPDKLSAIRAAGGTEAYAGITAVKCRAAAAWLRDVLSGGGTDRPWSIEPTPVPDLPPELNAAIVQRVSQAVLSLIQQGQDPSHDTTVELMANMRTQVLNEANAAARTRAEHMGDKMADQLEEGGFRQALDAFLDDLTTFPSAFIKGPILRTKPRLKWGQLMGTTSLAPVVTNEIVLEWERVSPFDIYPSPGATSVQDGSLVERHRLSRADMQDMIGVKGYDEKAIRECLEDYGRGGLKEWLVDDVIRAAAEGQATIQASMNTDNLIDALQYWGSVQGKMLIEWGMTKAQVPDPLKEYPIEAWLVGRHVIRAVLNHDPLRRRPYYKSSYQEVPGAFWGEAVADLVRDPQVAANATMRALINNMAMASGPQVAINIDRLAPGETITTLTPWRIWQLTQDPMGNYSANNKPIEFFQPDSRAQELMAVFEKLSTLADEYSGIPRYLTGDTTGGAGRTASGLSLLVGNAAKALKAVLGNIDINILEPMLNRLYYHNMLYVDDPDLKGDVRITARGAGSLVAKEAVSQRRNEFLAATNNPFDMQIVGAEGRAEVLREQVKSLGVNPDKVVPPVEVLRQKLQAAAALAAPPNQGTPAASGPGGQNLQDGSPVTDHFSPTPQ